jgi:hypothetical protein
MPRFVILEHDHPFLHWDFMLESGDVLRTWRLHTKPQAGTRVQAEALGDHRKAYLDYEGPVSSNRGSVKRWDVGTFLWETDAPDRVVVQLEGTRYVGKAVLEQATAQEWTLTFTPASCARPGS